LERGRWTSYSACGIPYLVGGLVDDVGDLVARSPETFRRDHDVDVRLGHEVRGIDLDAREVEAWDDEGGRTVRVGFDELHLATGARPLRPPLPGIDHPMVHGVQTLDDAVAVEARVAGARRVTVVGGGYIGLEMAEAFVRRGREVTLVEAAGQLMPTLDADVAAPLVPALEGLGVDVRLGTPLARSAGGGRSGPTAASAPRPRASGPPATAASRTTWSPGRRSTWRWARSPTSRGARRASTSPAATPPSPACWAPRSRRCATSRSAAPACRWPSAGATASRRWRAPSRATTGAATCPSASRSRSRRSPRWAPAGCSARRSSAPRARPSAST